MGNPSFSGPGILAMALGSGPMVHASALPPMILPMGWSLAATSFTGPIGQPLRPGPMEPMNP